MFMDDVGVDPAKKEGLIEQRKYLKKLVGAERFELSTLSTPC